MEKKRNYKRFWGLLKEVTGGMESREMVFNWTSGKKEHLRDLTDEEYKNLCKYLENQLPDMAKIKRQRAKILSIATQNLGFGLNGNASRVDWERFNTFMKNRSVLRKTLPEYKVDELPKLVTQFELIAKKIE